MTPTLEQRLAQESSRLSLERNPFFTAVASGSMPRETIREYACTLAYLSQDLPHNFAALMVVCPDRNVRRFLLENLLEEEGAVGFTSEDGLRFDDSHAHPELARKFARAAGATDEQLQITQPRSPWFDEMVAAGRWVGPLAYMTIGVEANTPKAFEMLIPPFRDRYGFTDDDLEFLLIHVEADTRHGQQGRELLAAAAAGSGQINDAIEGARRGALAWWELHRRLARRTSEQPGP